MFGLATIPRFDYLFNHGEEPEMEMDLMFAARDLLIHRLLSMIWRLVAVPIERERVITKVSIWNQKPSVRLEYYNMKSSFSLPTAKDT